MASLQLGRQTGILAESPVAGFRGLPQGRGHKAVKRALSEVELTDLLAKLRETDARSPKRFPLELIVAGPAVSGIRYGTFRAMARANWSVVDGLLTVPDEDAKGGSGRTLNTAAPMAGGLGDLIAAALEHGARILGRVPRSDDPIFLWGQGYKLPAGTGPLNLALYSGMAKAQIARKTPQGKFSVHGLRHTCATRAARFGVPESKAAYWLGHSSEGMSRDVYTHIQSADLQIAATGSVPSLKASFRPVNRSGKHNQQEA